jgi:hypothetical protein
MRGGETRIAPGFSPLLEFWEVVELEGSSMEKGKKKRKEREKGNYDECWRTMFTDTI